MNAINWTKVDRKYQWVTVDRRGTRAWQFEPVWDNHRNCHISGQDRGLCVNIAGKFVAVVKQSRPINEVDSPKEKTNMNYKEDIANRIKVMQAYLDGKKIQWLDTGCEGLDTGCEGDIWRDIANPKFHPDVEYRIKPEPFTAVAWANLYGPENLALHGSEKDAIAYRDSTARTIKVRIEEIIE